MSVSVVPLPIAAPLPAPAPLLLASSVVSLLLSLLHKRVQLHLFLGCYQLFLPHLGLDQLVLGDGAAWRSLPEGVVWHGSDIAEGAGDSGDGFLGEVCGCWASLSGIGAAGCAAMG